jgi:lipopolysaccharide export system protein LptA
MKTAIRRGLLVAGLVVVLAAVAAAGKPQPASPSATRFGKYTVESKRLEGTIGGPWEFSNGVTVTGPEMTITCDTLKMWPTSKGGRDFDRAEATGNLVLRGRYLASDKTEWKVVGSAASGTYDAKAGQGVMRGGVKFNGANQTTKAVLTVVADKMIYEVKTQQFRFERGGEPVRVEWEEPEKPAASSKQEEQK